MTTELSRVLYLEDDPSISEIALLAMTQFSDLNVWHCDKGSQAISSFSTFAPHVLLFDVMLPGMDGVQTLAEIRKLPGGLDIPVIFMTAKAQIHEQQKYMDLGAIGIIVKPFDAFTLGQQIKSVWAARSPSRLPEHSGETLS